MALASAGYGAAYGLLPIGWIVVNVIFLYQLTNDRGLFTVLRESITHVTDDRRLQLLLVAFSLRRVLRRRLRLRHAGRGDRRDPHGARLHAARRLRAVADRQHRAGRVRRARHADHRAAERDRHRSAEAERDGRPPAAAVLRDRAVLAGVGLRRLPRHARRLAGDPGGRPRLRHPAVPRLQLPRPVAGRRRRRGHLDGGARRVPEGVEAGQGVAAGQRRAGRRRGRAAVVGHGAARVDAVDHPERAGVRVGPAADQGVARQPVDRAHPGARPAQPGRARAAGRRGRQDRSRRSTSSTGCRRPAPASSSPRSSPAW